MSISSQYKIEGLECSVQTDALEYEAELSARDL